MKTIIAVIVVFCLSDVYAQVPNFNWAKNFGGSNDNYGIDLVTDGLGNVYTIGNFAGSTDFDPGPGTFNLVSAGIFDIYVTKLNALGNFIWAKRIGGPLDEYGRSIELDPAGNVIIGGSFQGTVDFDPGPGSYTMAPPTATNSSYFVLKLDASGNFVWAVQFGIEDTQGQVGSYSAILDVDASGNIYSTGNFIGAPDFDPGPGSYTMASVGLGIDLYVLKLNNNGGFIWARQGSAVSPNSIAIDQNGDVIIGGGFSGTCDFDPGPSVSNLSAVGIDGFIFKLSANGNFLWAKNIVSGSGQEDVRSLASDPSGNLVATGGFNSPVTDFDPGPLNYTFAATGVFDIFVSKLDPVGNFIWARQMGGPGNDWGYSVDVNDQGDIFTTGSFSGGPTDFDPGLGTYTMSTSNTLYNVFISKLTTSGAFAWALQMGNPGNLQSSAIAVDQSGSVYTTGHLELTGDFDPGPGTYTIAFTGWGDAFVSKLSLCNQTPVNISNPGNLRICSGNTATLIANSSSAISWYATQISTSAIGTGSTFTSPVLTTGSYTYFAGASSCTVSGTRMPFIVTVTPLPTISISAPSTTLCSGSSMTLNASGADTYTWVPGIVSSSIAISPTSTINYSVTGTNTLSTCSAGSSIGINLLPTLSLSISQKTICEGTKIIIVASGASSYSWSTGSTSNSIAITSFSNTTFSVTGIDAASNCSMTKSGTISIAQCLGTETLNEERELLKIFPNPNNGRFQVESSSTVYITIYDPLSKIILEKTIDAGVHEFNLMELKNGLYFIRTTNSQNTSLTKWVKEY